MASQARVHELADRIRQGIADGRWAELPTVVWFAREWHAAAGTVTKALRSLADEGLVLKTQATRYTHRWVLAEPGFRDHSEYAHTIADRLTERIRAGAWEELPGIARLAVELDTSDGMVTAALRLLAKRGLAFKDDEAVGDQWRLLGDDGKPPPTRLESTTADLRARILSGELREFPRVEELYRRYPVKTSIVNAAVRRLASDGLIVKVHYPHTHYVTATEVTWRDFDGTCSVRGCSRRRYARGRCTLHDHRIRSFGTTEVPVRRCEVDGCANKHYGKGYCRMHYYRLRNTGTLDASPGLRSAPARSTAAGRRMSRAGTAGITTTSGRTASAPVEHAMCEREPARVITRPITAKRAPVTPRADTVIARES